MSQLSSEDRRLLELARDGHEPTQVDRDRVRSRLLAGIGVGTGFGVTTSATSAVGAMGAMGVVKMISMIAVVGAIGGGALVAYQRANARHGIASKVASPMPFPVPSAVPPAAPVAMIAPLGPLPVSVPSPGVPSPAIELYSSTTHSALAIEVASHRVKTVKTGAAAEGALRDEPAASIETTRVLQSMPQDLINARETAGTKAGVDGDGQSSSGSPRVRTSVEDEMGLVRAGVAALHAGDVSRAIAFFDAHARAYPTGVLAEERAAERVIALCTLNGPRNAQPDVIAFMREFPTSPLIARVRASCASNP